MHSDKSYLDPFRSRAAAQDSDSQTQRPKDRIIQISQLLIAMDEDIGIEFARDKQAVNQPTKHEPDAEGTAIQFIDVSPDEASRISALRVSERRPRRWSDKFSELTPSTTAAQLKIRLNPYSPKQAGTYALAERIADSDAKSSPRTRVREAISIRRLLVVCFLMMTWFVFRQLRTWTPYLQAPLFLGFMVEPIVGVYPLGQVEREGIDNLADLLIYTAISWFCVILVFDFISTWPLNLIMFSYYFCLILRPNGLYLAKQDKLNETLETDKRQNLESLVVETPRYHQLEILCRYGDYLAERLGTLRQHISENKLETRHRLSEYWTETSAILRGEERQETTPCHDLVCTAAQDLKWKQEVTIFMIHEYAKRNNLMHAELFNLVDSRDWYAIEQRCKEDIEKLRELCIDPGADSNAAIENWMQIIKDFRDRWVRQSEDGSTWGPRLIIQEAIVAGVDDRASLNKLAMLPKDATRTERDKAINTVKKENLLKEAQRNKLQQQANAALQADNRLLEAEVKKLKDLLDPEGASGDLLEKLKAEVQRNDELEKENKRCQNRIKQLEDERKVSRTRERALKRDLNNLRSESNSPKI